jgi:hypothetical protein
MEASNKHTSVGCGLAGVRGGGMRFPGTREGRTGKILEGWTIEGEQTRREGG